MNDYFRASLSSQQEQADVRQKNSARKKKGEKRGVEEKGRRKKRRKRRGREGPGAAGSSPLPSTKGPRRSPGSRAQLEGQHHLLPSFTLLPTPQDLPLINRDRGAAFRSSQQKISDKTDSHGKTLVYCHLGVLTFNALVSQKLISCPAWESVSASSTHCPGHSQDQPTGPQGGQKQCCRCHVLV